MDVSTKDLMGGEPTGMARILLPGIKEREGGLEGLVGYEHFGEFELSHPNPYVPHCQNLM